jgi:hypothetical protein
MMFIVQLETICELTLSYAKTICKIATAITKSEGECKGSLPVGYYGTMVSQQLPHGRILVTEYPQIGPS